MKEVYENVYDVYNHTMKTDGIVGTLTTNGNTSFTHSGTFLVIEKDVKDEPQNSMRGGASVHVIGQMDNTVDHTFESANRVYDRLGVCPTIPTCAGGNIQPKVLVRMK